MHGRCMYELSTFLCLTLFSTFVFHLKPGRVGRVVEQVVLKDLHGAINGAAIDRANEDLRLPRARDEGV